MPTTAQDERSKKVQETLDRSRELLAQADELREKHAQLQAQFPKDFEPGVALAWMQENAKADPKVAQALDQYEIWLSSRPVPATRETRTTHMSIPAASHRQWRAI